MEFTARQTLFFLSSVLFLCAAADHHAPEVHTKLGSLRGEYVSVKGKETGVHAFLGVPFAKPPLGPALRLSAPQPVDGWEGVRDATKQPPMCVQNKQFASDLLESIGAIVKDLPDISEDCLYLNIYTPADRANNAKLPVMVWIHGGGFMVGSASTYDGSALAAYQDVVVVLIQYRLGVLGFLSTGDEHMSGNFGLLDQVFALKWVQEHIHNFGGDPGLVTIFGESAGGVSVSLQLLTPLSEGLFHHAIAESGFAAMDTLFTDDPLPAAMVMVANISGCSLESTKNIADCIKNLDINTIESIAEDATLRFPINVDGHFLTKPVDELFHKHELLTKPFMTGVNSDEGGWLLSNVFAPPNWTEGMDREQIMQMLFMFYPDPKDEIRRDLITNEYAGTGEDRVRNRKAFTELVGDLLFTIPAIKTANAHRDAGAPVYLYHYHHPPSFLQAKRPSFVGSDHADEILTVLGFCFTTSQYKLSDECTEEEENLSKIMMNYWGNFARTGSPNGKGLVHWPKYGADEEYLKIETKKQAVDRHLKQDQYVFMTQTVPEKVRQHEEKQHTPEVHTKLGSLRGEYVSVKGKETGVHAFLGVPFAKPPLGPALRLSAPQPVDGWEGVRDATKQPPMCVQNKQLNVDLFESIGVIIKDFPDNSEDCLYLNIYTPADRANNAKLPVMVWIHGGGFTMGSASTYDGSALAAYQNMVVVLIQYRLGVLGFLSTGDEHMSGNFGLLDQVFALKWVQEHIHNFGGDPGLVTIFGESAGGVSVSLQLLTPLSEGLFHHAIAESGTAAMDSLFTDDPLPVAKVVANVSGCSLESTKNIADCIKNLDINTIESIAEDERLRYPVNVDRHFLRKPVDELFHKHELLTKPFMTGVNSDEGGWLLSNIFAPPNWTEGMDREQITQIVSMFYADPKDEIRRDLIIDEYAGTGEDRVRNRKAFTELLGDLLFTIPAIKTANAHRDAGAPVYLYQYHHPPAFLQAKRPSFVGSDHGDEIFTVLGFCFTTSHVKLTDKCTEEEENLSQIMMNYWGNFARTGSPNGKALAYWPKYGADEMYIRIEAKKQGTYQHLQKDKYVFMTQTVSEKIRQHEEKQHSEL